MTEQNTDGRTFGQASTPAGAHVQSQRQPRRGPLPDEVRKHLANGFGAKVRELRRERGWTQQQLAEAIGRDRATVSRFETGRHRPTVPVIRLLAGALATPRRHRAAVALELGNLAGRNVRVGRRHAAKYATRDQLLAAIDRRVDAGTDRAARARVRTASTGATTLRPQHTNPLV